MPISSERATVPRILLLSGTSEGRLLARALLDAGLAVTATVTEDAARTTLFGSFRDELSVEVGGFSEPSLEAYLAQGMTDVVLDATHPFAARITSIAARVCRRSGVPYVRFERPDCQPPAGAHFAATFAEAAEALPTIARRALLTLGARQLKHFAQLHDRVEMFARILPATRSLDEALAAGFSSGRILCLRPPFSQAFNRALLEEYRIDTLVTKDSGVEGGVVEKVRAAEELGVKVLMIRRPALENFAPETAIVHSVAAAVEACLRIAAAAHSGRLPQP